MLNEYKCLLTESAGGVGVVLLPQVMFRVQSFEFRVEQGAQQKPRTQNTKQIIFKIMAKFEKFEEIEVWQKARTLSKIIYKETSKESFNNDFVLIKQIRRSTGSTMDNIAEGFERGGNKEFIQFLYISKGSAAESKSQLYRAMDQNYISEDDFTRCYDLANEIGFKIGKLIQYLKNSTFKGSKYKVTPNTEPKTQNSKSTTQNTEH